MVVITHRYIDVYTYLVLNIINVSQMHVITNSAGILRQRSTK